MKVARVKFPQTSKMSCVETQVFLVWSAIRRKVQERVIVHENVSHFGTATLEKVFGDLYIIALPSGA